MIHHPFSSGENNCFAEMVDLTCNVLPLKRSSRTLVLLSAPALTFGTTRSLGLTVYEVATRMELPGDGEYWHAMRDGTAVGLPSSRSRELGALLRRRQDRSPRRW
ncbi:unnamed protein product [Pylaiella littoralis]